MFPTDWNPSVVHMPSVRMLGGTGPAIAVAGLLAMAGASLLAAVARTRRHGADPDGLTAD